MSTKRHVTRSTARQIKVLVDYMATNPSMANNDVMGPLGPKEMQTEWEKLENLLRNYGPTKSVGQWKHTWRDLKKKARQDAAMVRRTQVHTSNNKDEMFLSDQTNKVLSIIKYKAADETIDTESGCEENQETKKTWKELRKVWQDKKKPSTIQCSGAEVDVNSSAEKGETQSFNKFSFSVHTATKDSLTNDVAGNGARPNSPTLLLVVEPHSPSSTKAPENVERRTSVDSVGSRNSLPQIEIVNLDYIQDPRLAGNVNYTFEDVQSKPTPNKKRKKPAEQKKNDDTGEIAASIRDILKEKKECKKKFYEDYILEMRKQTNALIQIANQFQAAFN